MRDEYRYNNFLNRYKKVRVFLSSTFKDMSDERDVIMHKLAPAMREWGRKYDIDLEFVDLRWGISQDIQQAGRTLPVCLQIIDECIPFFISLVGEQRGSVADFSRLNADIRYLIDNPEKVDENNYSETVKNIISFLRENKDSNYSYTELEILYAAAKKQNGFLYLLRNASGKNKEDMDENTRAFRERVRALGAEDYYSNYDEKTGKHILFFVGKPDENGEIKLTFPGEKTKEEMNTYGINFLEFIENYLKEKCVEIFGEDRFSTDKFLRDIELEKDFWEYNRIKSRYLSSRDFSISLERFLAAEKDKPVLKINCDKADRAYYITQAIKEIFDKFDVDIVFSYDKLSAREFGRRMSQLFSYKDITHGVMPAYPAMLKEMYKKVVVIAPDGLSDIMNSYGTENVIYITFEDIAPEETTVRYIAKPITYIEKRQYIEATLKEYGKTLDNMQIDAIAASAQIETFSELENILSTLISEKYYRTVNQKIEECFGEELRRNVQRTFRYSFVHIREAYNAYLKVLCDGSSHTSFELVNRVYWELADMFNDYILFLDDASIRKQSSEVIFELSEIAKMIWALGSQLIGYWNENIVNISRIEEGDVNDRVMSGYEELEKVKNKQIYILYFIRRLNSGELERNILEGLRFSKLQIKDFSIIDDLLSRTLEEQYYMLDYCASMQFVAFKELSLGCSMYYIVSPEGIEAKMQYTMKKKIATMAPGYSTYTFTSFEDYPVKYAYTAGDIA